MSSWWQMENINGFFLSFFLVCSVSSSLLNRIDHNSLGMTMSTIAIYLPTGTSICHFNALDILARSAFFLLLILKWIIIISKIWTEAASRTPSLINFHTTIIHKHTFGCLAGWLITTIVNYIINRLMKMLLMIVIAPINEIMIIKMKCSQNENNLNGSNKTYLKNDTI